VERFSSYASNLIDLSAYQTDKMLFDIKPGNLRNLLEEYAADNIYLRYPVEVQDKIEFDDLKMRQLFNNIIDNANKYSGSGDIEIIVSNAPDIMFDGKSWQAIKLVIKDSGIGVPDDELENIFEPFRLSSRTSDGSGGKGLGLALVKAIITAHRGKVLVYNNTDKGCSIEIILPVKHPKVKFLGSMSSSHESIIDLKEIITKANEMEAKFHGKIPKILMVDDEKFVLRSAELLIQSLGYDFEAIASGEDAIEYINSDKFDADLIFLDMMLGDMTGLQVMGQIADKVRAANIPVIVQSGLVADDPNIVATIALGAKGFMGKPYKKNDIDRVIKESL
jgi:CheY-like chemotaxis protein/anti-sigma regulatory factor (Ser/Thr protein kinase)